jgi:mandelate racemase
VSAHLLTATPTAHYLEYVDWMDALLEEPLKIKDGFALVPNQPGHGMMWNKTAVQRLGLN